MAATAIKRPIIVACKRQIFNFHVGDTYPKFQPIPLASRGWQHRDSKGDYFTVYPFREFIDEQPAEVANSSFQTFNLDKGLVKNLASMGISNTTTIQELSIPKLLGGNNVIMTAETGSGKTLAFLLPLLQQIIRWKSFVKRGCNEPLGIIVTPGKELTQQIAKVSRQLSKDLGINIVALTGGSSKRMVVNPPVSDVDIVISTIGGIGKLAGLNIYKMKYVRHVIIDEADTLFDDSFKHSVISLLKKVKINNYKDSSKDYPSSAQLTINSATMPEQLTDILQNVVDTNSLIPVVAGNENFIRVPQKFLRVGSSEKPPTLLKYIKPKIKSKIPIIVFTNGAKTCDFIKIFLNQFNIKCATLHGELPLPARRHKFFEFQSGQSQILVTTNAGSRGLDTTIARDVINYDMPLLSADYIHRCGRIGRIGSPCDGRVINFISTPLEIIMTRKIEYAARKLKPIPFIDMMKQNNAKDEAEFLKHTTTIKDDEVHSLQEGMAQNTIDAESPLIVPH